MEDSIGYLSGRRHSDKIIVCEIAFVVFCTLVAEWMILPLFGRNVIAGSIPAGARWPLYSSLT